MYTCSSCGKNKTETISSDPNAHAWKLTEVLTEGETYHSSIGLYTCTRCSDTKEARLCAAEIFTDVPKTSKWFHGPIDWAFFKGITSGMGDGSFSPKMICTREQAMTFLYATQGKPLHEDTVPPFADVKTGKYYYHPIMWAVENKITDGLSNTLFGVGKPCTREQVVAFLWKAAGSPEPQSTESSFTDVAPGKYYYKAVLWANENDITSGVAEDKFGVGEPCTRAQMVTFLLAAVQHLIPSKEG